MSSKADIERLVQLINDGDVEALKAEDFDQFQYQGFDPYKIVESLLKVKTAKSIADDDFKKNIFSMVAIGMIKGSVNERNIKKMSDNGSKEVQTIISTYGIKMGGGKNQPSGVITFPRVMATFPDIAVRLVKVIGPKEFRGGPMSSTTLPGYLEVQVFPAVIPRDIDNDVKRMLMTAALCYSIDQTIQISNLQNPDLKSVSSTQSNFVNVGHGSPVPSNAVRARTFKDLKVADDYEKISAVLEIYKSKIDSAFSILTKEQFTSKLPK